MNSNPFRADLEEVKNYLKEAGLYERNMNVYDMMRYYNTIKRSEKTAKEEIERRNSFESKENVRKVEDLQTANTSSLLEDTRSEENCLRKAIHHSVSSKNPTKLDDFDDLDLEPTKLDDFDDLNASIIEKNVELKKPLDDNQVKRDNKLEDLSDLNGLNAYDCASNPNYSLPIYCQPEFLAMDFEDRKRILFDSHIASLEKFYNAHCKSINPIQYGKPIMANAKFNGCLDRELNSLKEEDVIETVDINAESENTKIYTLRSGRQTKRKLCNRHSCNDTKKSKKNDNTVKIAKCPICSNSFVQDDIEEHTSPCGLDMETKVNFVNISHGKKIKCNICDEMILNTDDYELHVKECLAQANSNSGME